MFSPTRLHNPKRCLAGSLVIDMAGSLVSDLAGSLVEDLAGSLVRELAGSLAGYLPTDANFLPHYLSLAYLQNCCHYQSQNLGLVASQRLAAAKMCWFPVRLGLE